MRSGHGQLMEEAHGEKSQEASNMSPALARISYSVSTIQTKSTGAVNPVLESGKGFMEA